MDTIKVHPYHKIDVNAIKVDGVEVTSTPVIVLGNIENLNIQIVGNELHLSWDEVAGANSYKIYTSDDPYDSSENWTLEAEGISETSWTSDISGITKKFYYVVASTETPNRTMKNRKNRK